MQDHRDQGRISSVIFIVLMAMVVLAMCGGCATVVPVAAAFPAAPGATYQQSCPDLQKIKDQPQLSDVSNTISVNYSSYYECAVKLDAWIQWYSQQKTIFESAGK
jgi:flagellar basal body-associated protein FliL